MDPKDSKDSKDPKDPKDPIDSINTDNDDPAVYEQTHVHHVYDAIADHFSATRYAPWPRVARFLDAQPRGSVGVDVGCGNGKYLIQGDSLFLMGSDRSGELLRLAREKAREKVKDKTKEKANEKAEDTKVTQQDVLLADSLALPFRPRCADFAICIAVVHHLSTRERRQAAVAELLACVKRVEGAGKSKEETTKGRKEETTKGRKEEEGRVLLYVWALEQASSRRGWKAGDDQDLLVPWVKKQPKAKKGTETTTTKTEDQTFQRYYHLYREGELEEDVRAVGGQVVSSGYERDNWWVIANPG